MSETPGRVRFRDDHGEDVDRRWGTRRRDTWEIVINKDGRPVKRDEPVCTEEAGRPLRLLIAARPVRQAAPDLPQTARVILPQVAETNRLSSRGFVVLGVFTEFDRSVLGQTPHAR